MPLKHTTVVVNAAHPRALRTSTARITDRLQIVVNRYSPPNPHPDGITLFFLHCTGYQKEVWEETIARVFESDIPIREAIAYDWVGHGDSAVLNEQKLGSAARWTDGGRDLLQVIAQLDIPQPIVAVGHSMGGSHVLSAGYMHPSLFKGLIAIEPIAHPFSLATITTQICSLLVHMPDQFPDRQSAISFLKSTQARSFDPAVLNRLIECSFYDTKSKSGEPVVKLKSCAAQQVAIYQDSPDSLEELVQRLPFIESPTLLVHGENAKWNDETTPARLSELIKTSTTQWIPGGRHMVPLEMPGIVASIITVFLTRVWEKWATELRADKQKTDAQIAQEVEDGVAHGIHLMDTTAEVSRQIHAAKRKQKKASKL
ncbi:Alpha/Beta hydrolase protein [Myxozyma melibiosi]|uniref:Alpha/Beta hydrolase protein n=1 Tax=Myxozyma melibiosi TaxID=54550 RepID=A0ABR1FFG2_9ASCO